MDLLDKAFPDIIVFRSYWWVSYKSGSLKDLGRSLSKFAQAKQNKSKQLFTDYECIIWPILTKLATGDMHWYILVAYPKAGKIVVVDSVNRDEFRYEEDLNWAKKILSTQFGSKC